MGFSLTHAEYEISPHLRASIPFVKFLYSSFSWDSSDFRKLCVSTPSASIIVELCLEPLSSWQNYSRDFESNNPMTWVHGILFQNRVITYKIVNPNFELVVVLTFDTNEIQDQSSVKGCECNIIFIESTWKLPQFVDHAHTFLSQLLVQLFVDIGFLQ